MIASAPRLKRLLIVDLVAAGRVVVLVGFLPDLSGHSVESTADAVYGGQALVGKVPFGKMLLISLLI